MTPRKICVLCRVYCTLLPPSASTVLVLSYDYMHQHKWVSPLCLKKKSPFFKDDQVQSST